MKVTDITISELAYRREERDMQRDGWERVGEGGGRLWELTRGFRWNHEIKDVCIAADKRSLWVKIEPKAKQWGTGK
jgi:hypothetical protein